MSAAVIVSAIFIPETRVSFVFFKNSSLVELEVSVL